MGREMRGLEAWDERFTHVEVAHFRKVCGFFSFIGFCFGNKERIHGKGGGGGGEAERSIGQQFDCGFVITGWLHY